MKKSKKKPLQSLTPSKESGLLVPFESCADFAAAIKLRIAEAASFAAVPFSIGKPALPELTFVN